MADPMQRTHAWLADWLVRGRVVWFAVGLVLTGLSWWYLHAHPLRYNRSMEGFFPADDPRVQLYRQNKHWFGGEGTILVVYRDPALWSAAGLARQRELAQAIETLKPLGVRAVACLAASPAPAQPWITIESALRGAPDRADALREQVQKTRLYQGVFVAPDQMTTALVVQLEPVFPSAEAVAECLEAVRQAVRHSLNPAAAQGIVSTPHLAGTLLMIHDVYEYTERDGRLLELASVLLMGAVIAVSFRSGRWVGLPFLIVYASLTWSRALWGMWRGELTMVSSAISSLVSVIGVATVVHFGMHYRELRRRQDTAAALWLTLLHIGPPIFWVLATTAGGFAALLICELKPVLDFAWVMLIATMFVGLAVMLFLPLGVMGFRTRERLDIPGQGALTRGLVGSLHWVERRPWQTVLALLVPAAVVALGVFWLKPQTDFTGNFRRDTEVFQAYDFIETRFGGTGQLDLVFDSPPLERLEEQDWRRLRELERALEGIQVPHGDGTAAGVTKVLGLVDFVDFFDGVRPTIPLRARLFLLEGRIDEARKELGLLARLVPDSVFEKFQGQSVASSFFNRADSKMRVTLQVRERLASHAKQALIAEAQRRAQEILGPESRPQVTGIYVMLAHLIESLLDDQSRTFALSLATMFAMGILAFRSLRLALVAMVPTVVPVAAIVGTMGWVGLPVNIATAMLASVAMGMTIDSSILYIYRFNQERRSGTDFETALARTHGSTGIALIISNIALVLGFGVLVLSRFIPLVHFGILTGLALFGGMVGNLVLLPLLLHLVLGPGRERKGPAANPRPAARPAAPGASRAP